MKKALINRVSDQSTSFDKFVEIALNLLAEIGANMLSLIQSMFHR